jgi:hypothetical protein
MVTGPGLVSARTIPWWGITLYPGGYYSQRRCADMVVSRPPGGDSERLTTGQADCEPGAHGPPLLRKSAGC